MLLVAPGRDAAAVGRAVADRVSLRLHHLHGLLHCGSSAAGGRPAGPGGLPAGHQVSRGLLVSSAVLIS